MKKYEYLDHTADLKIRAYGKTIEEAFVNTAIGGFDFLTDTKKVKKKIEKNISISANRIESLLYDFLEELLFMLDTDGLITAEIKDLKIQQEKEKYSLTCIALGDNYKNYDVKGNIKSVTYSEMSIKKEKNGFIIEVVLDI
ncbi:MAG: archease [Nanoarchaeota archaeon]|nr:archease [Nanoarchaeota archaeon]MBU1321592.1 archease [Nanoarchaeota archaeon]MBU1598014.1 archease [Nanoarchaeota archaeon]MBU2440964.1 archease [Nanoarchaeota archaeon]